MQWSDSALPRPCSITVQGRGRRNQTRGSLKAECDKRTRPRRHKNQRGGNSVQNDCFVQNFPPPCFDRVGGTPNRPRALALVMRTILNGWNTSARYRTGTGICKLGR
eukprot:6950690-Pyramimonas_sp.AAC.1